VFHTSAKNNVNTLKNDMQYARFLGDNLDWEKTTSST